MSPDVPFRHFHDQLAALNRRLLAMSEKAEALVELSVDALLSKDQDKADAVIAGDKEVDAMELEIEAAALELLALQQPMARDLRFIVSAIKVTSDLERVGDHAVNIADSGLKLASEPPLKPLVDIPRMADLAIGMLRDALDAFVRGDAVRARELCQRDDLVDDLDDQLFRELLTYMMENPANVTRSMELILVARNLERVADLATNVAEEVVFIAEARIIKHHAEETVSGMRPGEEDFGRA
jgi:phosphate transport system protein